MTDQKKTFASLKLQSINKTYTVLFTKIQRNQNSRSQQRKNIKRNQREPYYYYPLSLLSQQSPNQAMIIKRPPISLPKRTRQGFREYSCLEHKPFNSHEWPRENFSLQYQYNIKQTSDESKENISQEIISWSNT